MVPTCLLSLSRAYRPGPAVGLLLRRPRPVCLLLRRPRPVGAGCGASLGRSGAERADCTAVLGLAARRGTRCAPCRRSAQTAATKVLTNALRAGRKPCAPRRPRGAPHPAPTGLGRRACGGGGFRAARFWPWSVLVGLRAEGTTPLLLLQSVAAGGARWWRFQRRAEEHSRRGGARSALRQHSHRGCLSVAPAGRAASSSVRPGGEHHRSVGAFSARPRRCEPPPGTACRDARQRQWSPRGSAASSARQRQGSPRGSAAPSARQRQGSPRYAAQNDTHQRHRLTERTLP
jgi:hypothetical protein